MTMASYSKFLRSTQFIDIRELILNPGVQLKLFPVKDFSFYRDSPRQEVYSGS